MKRYIEGKSRAQMVLMPESLDDFIGEDNPVRVIDLFVDMACGKADGITGESVLTAMRAVFASIESSRTGKAVHING